MPETYSGIAAKVMIGTKVIGHISKWDLDLKRDMVETKSFGVDYTEREPGIKDWSASCDGTADFSTDSGQTDLLDAYEAGTKLTILFYLSATKYFTGSGFFDSIKITQDVEGKAEITASVVGTSGITKTLGTV